MEDAISQLQDLGVTRGQAKKALARYNNDVARAADFIFSGNNISDDEAEENIRESDEALALRLTAEEEQSFNTNNPFKEATPAASETVKKEQIEPEQPTKIIQQNAENVSPTVYDSSKWSLVPFKSSENATEHQPATNTTTSPHILIESLLTWWKDPEDPSDRIALDNLPIGLRPPSYNFAYSPVILQALFHVTAFQHAVLSFRPSAYGWGAPKNYWKGFGEPIPGCIVKQVVTKRHVVHDHIAPEEPLAPPPSFSSIPLTKDELKDADLISFDSTKDSPLVKEEEKVNNSSSDINENIDQEDLPPLIVETTPVEEPAEFVDHIDTKLQLMPNCLQALSEMQKLFAFLGNTKRLYGSVSHYVKALNTKLTSSGWEASDKTFEAFLDMMINSLVEADEQADSAMYPNFVPIFRSLFLVKARIEDERDYEEEELYYLTLGTNKSMCSFHDCLDPLVFESYQTERDEEADPSISDEEEEGPTYKFTTFKQTPPILMVVLDNRTGDSQKTDFRYIIDKTIYMDRYMTEKKDQAFEGFKEMESCRREISKSRAEMEKLKCDSSLSMDKRDLLIHTLNYFEQKQQDGEMDKETIDSLKKVLNSVKEKIESRLDDLENIIMKQRERIHHIFDREDMKENAYELRASFHHDGKSGTGHYWEYIWIEPSETSLLKDIPSEGGWFKFCDAYVTTATEFEIYNDPVPPFSLMYVSASAPKFTRQQLYKCIPEELKGFMTADNDLLDQEIHAHDHLNNQGNASLISTTTTSEDEDAAFTEKTTDSQLESNFADLDLESSAAFDDNISVGTAVGHQQNYLFTGQASSKLKDLANSKIIQVAKFANDDYRLLQSFEIFLARNQNQLLLEHLYLLYSSEKVINGVKTDEIIVDEEGSKKDDELKSIWHEYEHYLVIGDMVTRALMYFVKKDFSSALQSLLDSKRREASWKTNFMWNVDISNAFSGLATISFNQMVETFGKACLKTLNECAFFKASHESYRTGGLKDAIRIAHQAQTVIGPDKIRNDQVYLSLGELWLTFTEQQGVVLTDSQAELLNTLVMTYLEGQAGDAVSGIQSRSASPIQASNDDELKNIPLWQKYKIVCSESEQLLATLFK